MDLNTKLKYCRSHIESVARHDDMDAAVREAALDRIVEMVEAERTAARERLQAKLEAALGATEPQT